LRVLIFGVSGFVGSHLAEYFRSKAEVFGTYRLWNPYSAFAKMGLHDEIGLIWSDITVYQSVKEAINYCQPDVVVHLAAQAHVRKAISDPRTTYLTNVIGTVNVLEACISEDMDYVVVFSTDKVYGNRVDAVETDPLVPTEPYSASKICADYIAQSYMDRLKLAIVRPCNIYGFDTNSRIVPNVIRQCLRGERPKVFNETKHHTRQYIYVFDVCRAVDLLINSRATGIFNVGTDDILTQEEVVRTICNFFDIEPEYVSAPEKYRKEIERQSVNWSKIRSIGFEPSYTFEEGIKETIEMFRRYEASKERRW